MKTNGMRSKIVQWLGKEFICISCESRRDKTATAEMEEIFDRIREALRKENLSLDQTIRARLWAVDRESRDLASDVRASYNVGKARAATSSYIAPGHFSSDARVGLDLIALKPSRPNAEKIIVESIPPRKPINYLIFDSILVLAGKTVVLPTLKDQLAEILPRVTAILSEAQSHWDKVVNVGCYLHRSQTVEELRKEFARWVKTPLPRMEIVLVDGYSAKGKLIEVEVTAEIFNKREKYNRSL